VQSGLTRRARSSVLLSVACAVLAGPGVAGAHSRAPAAALDYRLRITSIAPPVSGVRIEVLDGDRELRLTVEPSRELTVLGLLGEAFVRFDQNGVWVNAGSPTAAADRLVPAHGAARGWIRLTRSHELSWHDHRLAPPANLPVGSQAAFALRVEVDGRPAVVRGSFNHVARPRLWPWLLGAVGAVAVLVGAAVVAPRRRGSLALLAAAAAAAAALVSSTGFATGLGISRLDQWLEVGAAAVLALGAAAVMRLRNRAARAWWAMVIGVIAAALGVGSLEVFWHGVVISSLPATLGRVATGVAALGGVAAAVLGVLADTDEPQRRPAAARAKAVAR
jgi:hypothetical protein